MSRTFSSTLYIRVPEGEPTTVETFPVHIDQSTGDVGKRLEYRVRLHRQGEVVLEARARAVLLKDEDSDLHFHVAKDAPRRTGRSWGSGERPRPPSPRAS